ncbi:MAG: hypothetical protein ACI4XE_02895 [Acutalibacteraceae bacterium]
MKKVILFAITAVLASAILITAGVGARADYQKQQNPKVEINPEKTYFAFFCQTFGKGAAAVCLDNRFTAFADCEDNISLCSVDEEDNRTVLYEIGKDNVRAWFSGETKRKAALDSGISGLLGGLSGVGIVVDSEKTNILIRLDNQPVEHNTRYYLYIPEDYFIDESGNTNAGGYIEINFGRETFAENLVNDIFGLFDSSFDFSGIQGTNAA